MNRLRFCLCLAALIMATAFACAATGVNAPLSEKARVLFDNQPYMRGDRDGAVRFSLASSRELQDTPLAELAVRVALFYNPSGLSNITVGETEARRILNAESDLSAEYRDSLRRFIARSLVTTGRRDEAMKVHERRGLAMSWLAAGPFPVRSGGLAMDQMPKDGERIDETDVIENPPDAEQFSIWKKRPPWRRIPDYRTFPFVMPWQSTGRNEDGSMVLFTVLDMRDADNQSSFHIFAQTSWKLYVDGALVAEIDRNRREAPNEHMVQYSLSPGKHQVLLHLLPPPLDVDRNEVKVALRVESESAFTWDRELDEPSIIRFKNSRREARPLRFFSELAKIAEQSPAIMVAYALACQEQGMPDAAAWWAERAARSVPDDAVIALNAGICLSENPLLPPARRLDMAREWHLRALASRPDLVPSLLYLATAESSAGNFREAKEYLDRAYSVNPASLDVLIARCEWAGRFASGARAREAWMECGKAFPDSPSVQIAIASMPREGFLDIDRRLNACRQAVEAAPYMPEANLILAEALADSGNAQEADSVLNGAVDMFSGNVPVLVEIAEVYSRLGFHGQATRNMADAVRVTPDNDQLWRRLGDMHMAAGNQEAAEKFWRVSLAANPGQFQLSDMMAYLDGRPPRLDREGERDAIALTADAEWQRYDGDVVRLLDRADISFTGDGSYRRLSHEVDLALTRAGGEMLTGIDERGELLTARIVFPNGNTLEPEPFPGPGGLRLPVIIPGAARELRSLESTPSPDGTVSVAPWFFQDPNGRMSLLHSEYVVHAPKNFPLTYAVRNLGGDVEFEQTREEDDTEVYRWSAKLSRPRHEPDAVHVSERVAMIEIGVKTNWDDIVAAELRKLDGKLVPSVRMRTLLETLIRTQSSRPNPLQAARTIYRFVCDNIDPTPAGVIASHIHADRMGNRSLLLLALLRAAGLDAHPASARPSELFLHPPTWELPRRDIFTIPMVRLEVPGDSVYWLDTRFDSLPFGKITDDLSGATVLTFRPEGPLFETLPTLPAEDSLIFKERVLALPARDEPLVVSGRSLWRGVAGLLREQALDEADSETRKNLLLTSIFPVFPDAVLRQFDVQRTDDSEASSLERYEIEARSVLEERPEGVRAVSLCLASPTVISDATRNLRRRQTACHVKSVHLAEDRNYFRLPEGGTFTRFPKPAHILSRFGVYQLRVAVKGNASLEVIRNYHVPAQRIVPGDWADFLDFLEQVDLAEKQWIEYAVQPEETPDGPVPVDEDE